MPSSVASASEPAAAPDGGRITVFQNSTSHQRPRQLSRAFGGLVLALGVGHHPMKDAMRFLLPAIGAFLLGVVPGMNWLGRNQLPALYVRIHNTCFSGRFLKSLLQQVLEDSLLTADIPAS